MSQTQSASHQIVATAEAAVCRPWLRYSLDPPAWTAFGHAASREGWVLLALWADTVQVHALLFDPNRVAAVAVSTTVDTGRYGALSPVWPGAAWYERMIHDLWGHVADGAADLRPWLDHGEWPQLRPMAAARAAQPVPPVDPPLAPAADTVVPLGPIWGRIDEAAHLRLSLEGTQIRRAESLLGYCHKGTLTLMRGKSPRAAARFVARLSADATVAHSVAFAHAAENALDVQAPPRAAMLRIVMIELERIAGHLDNLAEVARLADAQPLGSTCAWMREIVLRAAEAAFGHRLMMDCVVPGGLALDIAPVAREAVLRALGEVASHLPDIRALHERASLAFRLRGVGRAGGALAGRLGVGGVVGRASGRAFDARISAGGAYGALAPRLSVREDGDAAARQHLRLAEIEDSLRLVSLAIEALPDSPLTVALPQESGEGIGSAESIRGDVWHWLRLDHGLIAAVFPRDPGWALWPLAERVLENASIEDADLIRTSFALPASGMDL